MLSFSADFSLGACSAIVQHSMILNRQRRVPVAIHPLQQFYERARRELGFAPESVTIQLISDATMALLNETFRKKHGPTDVLSFPANGARPTPGAQYVGDIAISPETARRNARRFSRSLPVEMRILILHGMIHLAGFDHETDHGEMDRLERRLRIRLGIAGRLGSAGK
jgi:probable rRNA maturation factor